MFPLVPFVVLAYFILYVLALDELPARRSLWEAEKTDLGPQLSLDTWLKQERQTSLHRLLQNISPLGENALEAVPGTVLASPSKRDPDYYYQWTRDAAITLSTLVNMYKDNGTSPLADRITDILKSYASLSKKLQRTDNLSGGFYPELKSLGEPKFQVSGAPFNGPWGRPQRDGPALRAVVLIDWLKAYNASNPRLWNEVSPGNQRNPYADLYEAKLPAASVIKADLEYVSKYWNETDGFDLWEETQGFHFFTAMVQLRALKDGAELANLFRDPDARDWYVQQSKLLESAIRSKFWDSEKGHLISTVGTKRTGLDCGVLLGSLHGNGESDENPYPPWSDEVLATLFRLARDQQFRHPINHDLEPASSDYLRKETESQQPLTETKSSFFQLSGTGIGRYPEDTYDGLKTDSTGNPWFLCTSTAAHILYSTSRHLSQKASMTVTDRSLPFWQSLLPQSIELGTYSDQEFMLLNLTRRLTEVGDEFLAVVRKHATSEGNLSEQFDRVTGFERGARDLTWSYGSFLEAVRARAEQKA